MRKAFSFRRVLLLLLGFLAAGGLFHRFGRSLWVPVVLRFSGMRTVADAVAICEKEAGPRLRDRLTAAGFEGMPSRIALLGFKAERRLELWAGGDDWRFVHAYPVLAASGKAGPKLKEGDRQVPEGAYRIEGLNPNSSYHLSMKLDYPNRLDREKAACEGRTGLGGDIFIHGNSCSIGCLAMGDEAIEEFFLLVHQVGLGRVEVLLAPCDLRRLPPPELPSPIWAAALYAELRKRLAEFPAPNQPPAAP